jgi:hypothetical protein
LLILGFHEGSKRTAKGRQSQEVQPPPKREYFTAPRRDTPRGYSTEKRPLEQQNKLWHAIGSPLLACDTWTSRSVCHVVGSARLLNKPQEPLGASLEWLLLECVSIHCNWGAHRARRTARLADLRVQRWWTGQRLYIQGPERLHAGTPPPTPTTPLQPRLQMLPTSMSPLRCLALACTEPSM